MTPAQLAIDFDAAEAERRRQVGMDQAEAGADPEWHARAREAIEQLAARGIPFTADDLRDLVGDPPGHHNALSAVVGGAARRRRIRLVGYTRSSRVVGHGNLVREWVGA